jgi:hypothetical protein
VGPSFRDISKHKRSANELYAFHRKLHVVFKSHDTVVIFVAEMGVRYKLPGKTPEQPKLEAVVKFSPTGDVHSTIAVKPSQNTAVAAGAATNLYTRKTRADIAGLLKFYVAGAPCVMRTGYATSNGVSMFLGTRVLGRFAVGIGASYGGTDHPAVMVVPRAPIPGHPAEAFDLSRLPALQKVRFGLFLDL